MGDVADIIRLHEDARLAKAEAAAAKAELRAERERLEYLLPGYVSRNARARVCELPDLMGLGVTLDLPTPRVRIIVPDHVLHLARYPVDAVRCAVEPATRAFAEKVLETTLTALAQSPEAKRLLSR
jgi:hypothetical protein